MSHTPGKWVAEQVGSSGHENPTDVFEVVADGYVRVCEFAGEADARLIAAAPDLLEVLKLIAARCFDYDEEYSTERKVAMGEYLCGKMTAAIAKAEGK